MKNNLLSFNILLIVLNYNIYKDQYSNIYISKASINEIKIHDLKACQYKQMNVFYISKKSSILNYFIDQVLNFNKFNTCFYI